MELQAPSWLGSTLDDRLAREEEFGCLDGANQFDRFAWVVDPQGDCRVQVRLGLPGQGASRSLRTENQVDTESPAYRSQAINSGAGLRQGFDEDAEFVNDDYQARQDWAWFSEILIFGNVAATVIRQKLFAPMHFMLQLL
ncbi:hypothetical protein GCM10017709_00770 [Glutamicibacter nicotianae]|uniref:Uncharacterized protein n=1 Tax=Glutamicibacter nicotianae TaxID=37929 RepID=A0ABQ0RNX4_GLUNI|nr:hypothetical protein ANI01nite_27200 [Glutamicibacter nicotianae]